RIKYFHSSVELQHSAADFWGIFRASTCAVERRRAQFFALLAEGKSEHELLALTQYSVSGARKVLHRYHLLGLAGLGDGRGDNPGAPSVLTEAEQQQFAARLREDFDQGIVWSGKMVQDWIQVQFGKTVYLSRTYEFMRLAGFSPQRPRPRHVGGNQADQEAFKSKS
ncbi:winged helix-turn-helix domain-containing protein, partial [Deinococcus sp. SM5_A1]|uniref:winged helix-turn-helix domain-containing protein n=1 Tax=Deinococcus sp. SM5_A1 TaxID=3379094 RepID=UPI00385FF009